MLSVTLLLVYAIRTERERQTYQHAVADLHVLAQRGTGVLDSLARIKCVVPGTIP